jgi:hypothetical protein
MNAEWRSKSRMATLEEEFVVDAKGRKTGVILSLKRYQKLLEDLHCMIWLL